LASSSSGGELGRRHWHIAETHSWTRKAFSISMVLQIENSSAIIHIASYGKRSLHSVNVQLRGSLNTSIATVNARWVQDCTMVCSQAKEKQHTSSLLKHFLKSFIHLVDNCPVRSCRLRLMFTLLFCHGRPASAAQRDASRRILVYLFDTIAETGASVD